MIVSIKYWCAQFFVAQCLQPSLLCISYLVPYTFKLAFVSSPMKIIGRKKNICKLSQNVYGFVSEIDSVCICLVICYLVRIDLYKCRNLLLKFDHQIWIYGNSWVFPCCWQPRAFGCPKWCFWDFASVKISKQKDLILGKLNKTAKAYNKQDCQGI